MSKFVLVVLMFSNNAFYGSDAVPTIEFGDLDSCKRFISLIKSETNVKTGYLCIQK